ncbi:MAG: hypothetical protein HKP00_13080 [Flavobacteriaceae bacterium]|nr:hypothetical protein [Flavobacteriaceae bacterium]NNK61542.1 hypothetical protein [Flavobacteriaceae bacterium]
MKKKLESELISIAHRILRLKGKEDVNKLHEEVSQLYEKLTVLKFAEENFDEEIPTIGSDSSFFGMLDQAFNNTVSDTIEVENKVYINLDESENEEIMEPVMEKIKDIVAQMPQETQQVDDILAKTIAQPQYHKNDFEEITADFKEIPVFDPVVQSGHDSQRSLNDKLKKNGLNIGLNDKLAFIKHLFNGKRSTYESVLTELNSSNSYKDATHFIETKIKPEFNNWSGKEEFENRFMEIIENTFQ